MYIFEAKYMPIIATVKHKAVDMERQCGSTFFFFYKIRSFDKNFGYLCFSLVLKKMLLRLFRFIEN